MDLSRLIVSTLDQSLSMNIKIWLVSLPTLASVESRLKPRLSAFTKHIRTLIDLKLIAKRDAEFPIDDLEVESRRWEMAHLEENRSSVTMTQLMYKFTIHMHFFSFRSRPKQYISVYDVQTTLEILWMLVTEHLLAQLRQAVKLDFNWIPINWLKGTLWIRRWLILIMDGHRACVAQQGLDSLQSQ